MTELNQIYKCNICGNIVEVIHTGAGDLVCCGKSMELQIEKKKKEEGEEKHIPVIEQDGENAIIKIGSVEHPMEEEHYIELIEVIAGEKVLRKFLKPGEEPKATFKINSEEIKARAYCNVHGLWSA